MYETGSVVLYGTALTKLWDRKFYGGGPKTITMINYGPDTVSPAVIQYSADQVTWGTADGTSFGSLGSGATGYSFMIDNRLFLRCMAASGAAAGTTALAWNINRP